MNQHELLKNLTPLKLSPEQRQELRRGLHDSLARTHGEHWAALQQVESKEDVAAANARIEKLQGPSPKDKAWLTQTPFGPEPPHVPGWDPGNRVNLAVAKQVYDEYVAAGKILRPVNSENANAEAAKPAANPPQRVPRYKVVGKIRFKRGTKKLREKMLREALERATRTPEELKIANDAWFDSWTGKPTP